MQLQGNLGDTPPTAPLGSGLMSITCSLCGCKGLHACMGSPGKAWSASKIAELHRVLSQYPPEKRGATKSPKKKAR